MAKRTAVAILKALRLSSIIQMSLASGQPRPAFHRATLQECVADQTGRGYSDSHCDHMICLSIAAAILLLVTFNLLSTRRGSSPYEWAARHCTKKVRSRGTRRFWRHFGTLRTLVIRNTDTAGQVRRVLVLAPTYGDDRLRALANSKNVKWLKLSDRPQGEAYEIPLFEIRLAAPVRVIGEIVPGLGVRFSAERLPELPIKDIVGPN
jgi:hypothetical protein